jgi:hypothetical protein
LNTQGGDLGGDESEGQYKKERGAGGVKIKIIRDE